MLWGVVVVHPLGHNGTCARSAMHGPCTHLGSRTRFTGFPCDGRRGRWLRVLALGFAGGSVLQFLGCATGVLPILLSLGESAILSLLLGGLVP